METVLTAENNIELEAYQSKVYIATGDAANAVMYVPQSLTEAQRKQARNNIGAGTSSFSGSYTDLTNTPSLAGYATEEYVDNAIANASVGGSDVDLSVYALKTDLAAYQTAEQVNAAIVAYVGAIENAAY